MERTCQDLCRYINIVCKPMELMFQGLCTKDMKSQNG